MANESSTTLNPVKDEPDDLELYIGVSICILGLILNVIVSSAICCCRRKRKMNPHTCFLLNIIISDVWISLSGVVFFGLKIYQNVYVGRDGVVVDSDTHWLRTHIVCANRITQKLWSLGTTANLLGLMLMSIDHFVAIRWSIKHHILMRKRVILSLIVSTWIVAIINSALYQLLIHKNIRQVYTEIKTDYKLEEWKYDEFCEQWGWYDYRPYGKYVFEMDQELHSDITYYVGFSIISVVFIILLCIYSYIAWVVIKVAKARHRRLRYTLSKTSDQRRTELYHKQAKGLLTTVLLLGTFVLLWAPLQIAYILMVTKSKLIDGLREKGDLDVYQIWMMVVCSCTTLADVFIYFLRSQEMSKLLKYCRQKDNCLVHESKNKQSGTTTTGSSSNNHLTTNRTTSVVGTSDTNITYHNSADNISCDKSHENTHETEF